MYYHNISLNYVKKNPKKQEKVLHGKCHSDNYNLAFQHMNLSSTVLSQNFSILILKMHTVLL